MMKQLPAFTLIETLVAISVLLISLAGPLSIAAQSLKSAYYARDEVTASYLAQEGLEYVRAVRDQNYLASPALPWLTGLEDCIDATCLVDFPNFRHEVCSSSCVPVRINTSTGGNAGLYQLQGKDSIYTRLLTISTVPEGTDPADATEIISSVTVTWLSGSISRTFVLSERLLNWR